MAARLPWWLSVQHAPLAVIIGVYLLLASGYALATPRWNNPDEPAHVNYVAEVAHTGRFPVLRVEDWDHRRLTDRLATGRFTTEALVDTFRYENH